MAAWQASIAGNEETKDCDRVEKTTAATNKQDKWKRLGFYKNAATGEMKIYANGELWHGENQ